MNQARKDIVRPGAASAPRILIVEDEADLSLLLGYNLEAEGYVVENVERGDEAELRLAENAPDLVILDWMLPGVSGLEICRRLRARESTRTLPVIMVTARGEEAERVRGLSVGADDYVVKPFSVPELMARVRALLRRAGEEGGKEETLSFQDLRLDLRAHEAWRGERRLALTRTEFLLLEMFLRHPRQVLTRSAIFESVWGYDFGASSNSLGVYMGYLRRKTEIGDEPRLLHTVRGVGYVLRTMP